MSLRNTSFQADGSPSKRLSIRLHKENDINLPARLMDDDLIYVGKAASLFELSKPLPGVSYPVSDKPLKIDEIGCVSSLIVQVTKTNKDKTKIFEQFLIHTRDIPQAKFTLLNEDVITSDRVSCFNTVRRFSADSLTTQNGKRSNIFSDWHDIGVNLEIMFGACLNLRDGHVNGNGAVVAELQHSKPELMKQFQEPFNQLKFEIVAWGPDLFFLPQP